MTDDGDLLLRGQASDSNWPYDAWGDTAIFKLDPMGNVANIEAVNACSCEVVPTPVRKNRECIREDCPYFKV